MHVKPISNATLRDGGLFLLRVSLGGGLAAIHGRGKLVAAMAHVVSGQEWAFVKVVASIGFPAPVLFALLAALTESGGGVLLAAGLATRFIALAIAFNMSVAIYFHMQAGQAAELAWAYLLAALTVALTGPGRYSVDHVLGARVISLSAEAPAGETVEA